MIPLKKPNLRRCLNFPLTATYDKYASFLENFGPYISGFLSGIIHDLNRIPMSAIEEIYSIYELRKLSNKLNR
jgi:hypothetical protein